MKAARILLLTLPFLVVACQEGGLINQGTPAPDSYLKPYVCANDQGADEGPGILGGSRLKRQSRLANSLVFLFQAKEGTKEDGNACTATLIAPNVVVTAAHCVDLGAQETRVSRTRVFLSSDPYCSSSESGNSDVRKVEEILIHPDYNETEDGMKNDLALIRFSGGDLPEGRRPLPVANVYIPMTEKDPVYLAGYGVTTDYEQGDQSPPLLRYVKVKPFSNPENFRQIQNGELSPRLIFDQRERGGACQGDSGGPALLREKGKLKIIGVASQVYARGEKSSCKAYVLHTSLTFHNNWLKTSFAALKTGYPNPFIDEVRKPVLEK